jgi:hypothetical protein
MLPTGPAIVLVLDPPLKRPGALVYRTAHGVGWVEPGYWDHFPPPRPAWHEFAGVVTDTPLGAVLQSADQTLVLLDADLVKGTAEDDVAVRKELEDLGARFDATGTTFAEQRRLLAKKLPVTG